MTPTLLPDPLPAASAPELTQEPVVASASPSIGTAAPPALAVPPPRSVVPSTPSGLYLRVAALKDSAAARDLESELQTAGFETEILSPSDDGLIRIISGPYDQRDEARIAAKKMSEWGVQPFLLRF